MKHRESGFTLIELVIAVAIVGILASFAVSTYQSSVLRSGRADAKAMLMTLAQRQERSYTQNFSYALDMDALVGSDTLETDNGFYDITLAATATTFTLTATAKGRQADDATCASFTVDNTGLEGATNANCW